MQDTLLSPLPHQEMIGVLFSDATITDVFAALLESRGQKVVIFDKLSELQTFCDAPMRLVTEARFAARLSQAQRQHCLLVGTAELDSSEPAVLLTQPLTEQKIESALAKFLK